MRFPTKGFQRARNASAVDSDGARIFGVKHEAQRDDGVVIGGLGSSPVDHRECTLAARAGFVVVTRSGPRTAERP
jgi:hypothetical protein